MLHAALLAAAAMAAAPPVPDTIPTPFTLGTKTPYWGKPSEKVPPEVGGEKCVPVQLQYVSRHGSRYSDREDFDDLEAYMKKYGDAITEPGFDYLKVYTNPFPLDRQDQLTTRGKAELFDQGMRWKEEFGATLLSGEYNPETVVVEHTYVSRTGRSASSFMLSAMLYDSTDGVGSCDIEPLHTLVRWNGRTGWDSNYTISDSDTILRSFSNCANYELDVVENDAAKSNAYSDQFKEVNITDIVVPKVAQKLGWNESLTKLKRKYVDRMYTACMYETTVFNKTTGNACDLFDEQDFLMYNFKKDLTVYYEVGPGSPFKDVLGCPLFAKIVEGLSDAIKGTQVKAALRFAHSDTVAVLLTFLGAFMDSEPLTPWMDWAAAEKRKWRTDTVIPMASNVAFILYSCSEAGKDPVYKVGLRHNENHMKWPKCGSETNVDYCSIEGIKAAYPTWATCNLEERCTRVTKTAAPDTEAPIPETAMPTVAPSTAPMPTPLPTFKNVSGGAGETAASVLLSVVAAAAVLVLCM